MTTITLPKLNPKSTSTKDAIISTLSEEWPLTAKEIYARVKKNNSHALTYQAVHKALKELQAEGIVSSDQKAHALNPGWIDSMNIFSKNLRQRYNGEAIPLNQTLTFNTLYEVDEFLVNLLEKSLQQEKRRLQLCLHWNHFWIPLFLSKKIYSKTKDLANFVDFYALSKGDSAIDQWCAEFWQKLMVNVKIGADIASTADLVVFGDYVVEVFYPLEIKQLLNEVYNETKDISNLNIDEFFHNVFERKTKILVLIHKNPQIAEQLREQTLSYFK